MSNTSVVLVAHGSRRAASNDEVRQLSECLQRQSGERYRCVRAAFLELAEPSIPDGIRQCIDEGAKKVLVVPYFLSAGRHVAEDIPAEVAKVESAEAEVKIVPYLGAMPGIVDLLLQTIEEHSE